MNTNKQCIVITGASSGIGRAFAEKFYLEGNQVIICGRRKERLDEMEKKFPGMKSYVCDIANAEQRISFAQHILESYPQVNMLMNNAGVQYAQTINENYNHDKASHEIETNLTALMHMSALFYPILKGKKDACIINISSGLAFVPLAFMPVYCATKAAVHSFCLSLRHQWKKDNIAVFEIAPPAVDTELGHDRRSNKNESHGGIAVEEFIAEAWQAIQQDKYEAPIAFAKGLHQAREAAFENLNQNAQ